MGVENFLYPRHGLQIHHGPLTRPFYLKDKLKGDGLANIKENKHAAYCAIPLTSAPDELKPFIKQRQEILLGILKDAGLETYDPSSAPLSPDIGLGIPPPIIYKTDKGKVVGARFFTLLDLLPSTGVGVEEEIADHYNRIAVVLHDKNIRTSRMQPDRSIHLQYDNLDEQRERLIELFRFLQAFEPGMGFDNGEPVLLGFQGRRVVNLEKEVYENFPELKYDYKKVKDKPAVQLISKNPEILQ